MQEECRLAICYKKQHSCGLATPAGPDGFRLLLEVCWDA